MIKTVKPIFLHIEQNNFHFSFKQEKIMVQLTFNLGLTLTGFRTTWPWCVMYKTSLNVLQKITDKQMCPSIKGVKYQNISYLSQSSSTVSESIGNIRSKLVKADNSVSVKRRLRTATWKPGV